MSRPTNKAALLEQSKIYFEKLLDVVTDPHYRDNEFAHGTMNRNVRDVLAHLHQWHLLMKDWYNRGMKGEKPDIPAKGYTWKTTPELNRKIWEECQKSGFADVKRKLKNSHKELTKIIEKHSDEELFEKKKYQWTGTTSLGAYFVSATSSHYAWALKLIKKGLKQK